MHRLNPQKRVEGRTFECRFPLPGTGSKGHHSTKDKKKPSRKPPRKNTAKSPQNATSKVGKPVHHPEPTLDEVEARRQERLEYDRRRNKTPERKEYHRLAAQARQRKAKGLGICRSCPLPAILGQTRCPTCAETHRQSRRHSDAKRRAAATQGTITE